MGVGRRSLRTERVSRFGRGVLLASSGGEQLASGGACFSLRAGRVSRFGRGVLLASSGADRMNWFCRYNLVSCPPLLGKSSYIENVCSMSEVLEGVIPCV